MMNKTIILAFAVLLSLSFASAFYEGQNLTQSQINNFNLNQLNFSSLDFKPEGTGSLYQGYYSHDFSYLTVTTQNSTTYPYIITRGYAVFSIPSELIDICFTNPNECSTIQDDIIEYVQPQKEDILNDVKQKVYMYQHKTILDMIENWIRGLFD